MADQNTTPEPDGIVRKEVKFSPDQFTVNENGELIIKNDELIQALQSAKAAEASPEQGVQGVGVVWVF